MKPLIVDHYEEKYENGTLQGFTCQCCTDDTSDDEPYVVRYVSLGDMMKHLDADEGGNVSFLKWTATGDTKIFILTIGEYLEYMGLGYTTIALEQIINSQSKKEA